MRENLESNLKIDHFAWLRSLGILAIIQHWYSVLLDLLLQVTELPFHLIATSHLVDEFSLESIHIRIEL